MRVLRNKFIIFLILNFVVANSRIVAQLQYSDTSLILMGTRFKLQAICSTKQEARLAVQSGVAEIQRIEKLISSHRDDSQTALINKNAGIKPVQVDAELFGLINRSKKVSELTKGAFDISFSPLMKVWKYDSLTIKMPNPDTVAYYRSLVNWQNIQTNTESQSVYLKTKGMAIGFGSIGKGYAANSAKQVMEKCGANSGFVNASGDILFWGKPIDKEHWTVAIKNPIKNKNYLGRLEVNNMAVVTSGDYENFLFIDGIQYSHIIDPRNGYPVKNARSVTVVCPDAEVADALATAVSVLGPLEGLALIDKIKNVECLLVNDQGEMFHSKNLQLTH